MIGRPRIEIPADYRELERKPQVEENEIKIGLPNGLQFLRSDLLGQHHQSKVNPIIKRGRHLLATVCRKQQAVRTIREETMAGSEPRLRPRCSTNAHRLDGCRVGRNPIGRAAQGKRSAAADDSRQHRNGAAGTEPGGPLRTPGPAPPI